MTFVITGMLGVLMAGVAPGFPAKEDSQRGIASHSGDVAKPGDVYVEVMQPSSLSQNAEAVESPTQAEDEAETEKVDQESGSHEQTAQRDGAAPQTALEEEDETEQGASAEQKATPKTLPIVDPIDREPPTQIIKDQPRYESAAPQTDQESGAPVGTSKDDDLMLPPPHKMNDYWGSAMQYSSGLCCSASCCGSTGLVGGVLSVVALFIPGSVLWYAVIGCCIGGPGVAIAPAGGVSSGVFLRECLGQRRGPFVWPLIAAYATELASVVVIAAAMVAGTAFVGLFLESIPGDNPQLNEPATWVSNPAAWDWTYLGGGGTVFTLGFALGVVSAVLFPSLAAVGTYQALGVPKAHSDTKIRRPGCFHANLPESEEPQRDPDAGQQGVSKTHPGGVTLVRTGRSPQSVSQSEALGEARADLPRAKRPMRY